MSLSRHLGGLSAAFVLAAPGAMALADPTPSLSVLLTPGHMDEAKGAGGVEVELRFSELPADEGASLLTLPIVIANTATIAETLTGLKVMDADGEIPLTIRDDPARGMVWWRHWLAGRATRGPVVVRYLAPVDNTPPTRGSGPPYALRTEGGGVSGVGDTFILLPEDKVARKISLRWDLRALPQGSTATCSFGEGDVALPDGPADQLASTVFMAGPMKREPGIVSETGFSSAWMGTPPFDPAPLMAWTNRLHGWMSRYFQDKAVPPYRVFLRYNPINAGGGTALTRSFLTTYGADTKVESLKGTLAHEMVHTWTESDAGQCRRAGFRAATRAREGQGRLHPGGDRRSDRAGAPDHRLLRSGTLRIQKLLSGADAAFGNQEGAIFDLDKFPSWPAAQNGGGTPINDAVVAFDLKALGFKLMSMANNHATDFDVEGMLETERSLDAAGVVRAGTGDSLTAARKPAYAVTSRGTVGLVSVAGTYTDISLAADANPGRGFRARPGLSPLRSRELQLVTAEQMATLRARRAALPARSCCLDRPGRPPRPNPRSSATPTSRSSMATPPRPCEAIIAQ